MIRETKIKAYYYDEMTLVFLSVGAYVGGILYFRSFFPSILVLIAAVLISLRLRRLHCTINDTRIIIRKNLLGFGNTDLPFDSLKILRIKEPYLRKSYMPRVYITGYFEIGGKQTKRWIPIEYTDDIVKLLYLCDRNNVPYTIQNGPFKHYDQELAHYLEYKKDEYSRLLNK